MLPGQESREQSSNSVFSLIIPGSGFPTSLYTIPHFLKKQSQNKREFKISLCFHKIIDLY